MAQDPDTLPSFGLLLRTGVLCVRTNILQEGESILNAAYAYRPERNDVKLALALLWFTSHRYFEAIELLREKVLREQPDFGPALGLLAMTLRSVNQPGWQEPLETVIQNNADAELVAMAKELLAETGTQNNAAPVADGAGDFVFVSRC